ncbi:MAG: histidine kinase [Lachnospiraceae bacterium]|nr:histidine kinase [Lachnospiraceae bacterium]
METIRNWNLIFSTAGCILTVLGLLQTIVNRYIDKRTREFFILFFSMLILYVMCIMLRSLTGIYAGKGWAVLSRILLFAQAMISSMLALLLTGFLLYKSGREIWWKKPPFITSAGLWVVYFIMLIYTQFSGTIYHVDDNNRYIRGAYFPVLMIPPVIIMMINSQILWHKRKRFTRKQMRAFMIFVSIPTLAMILQGLFFGVHIIVISTVISALFMYYYIVNDQMEKYGRQLEENARLKIDILLAQIQPHFLYNSLTTIKYLCHEDPPKAEKALEGFMTYLRYNMDSLAKDGLIPFEDELRHVKEYVELQKLRFGDELNVVYDLEYTGFKMPALTLQPIVGNAITYGIRRSGNGQGTVTISTGQSGDNIEIKVTDDGNGFIYGNRYPEDKQTHIGIKNVSDRIAAVTGGKLIIDSKPGKGTTVTIVLPCVIGECLN